MSATDTTKEQELDRKSAAAVDRFLAVYEQHPQKERFRLAMFKLQNRYPKVWLSLLSNNEQERADAFQWIKQRHNELAVNFGEELIK